MTKFTILWLNKEKDADINFGSFNSKHEAEEALPGILAALMDECAANEESRACIMAGSFFLEWPEDENGNRGQTIVMDWPNALAPQLEAVATIALGESSDQRGEIRIGETDDGWRIEVLRPDGETETDGAVFASRDEAMEAIALMWGRDGAGVWDLQWL